ncbi:MAG: hypothetical protein JXA54_03535 [Candidatus Heimdallarchaeota archaeon]|nr:hypothetical protein [Candidatus Heimdallarchaeota archaeon]
MVADIQWMFITDKYSLVEIIDNAIVVARFNQNELMRDLIEARCVLLEAKFYDDLAYALEKIVKINENIIDKTLLELVSKLIDLINLYKDGQIKIDERIDKVESRAID